MSLRALAVFAAFGIVTLGASAQAQEEVPALRVYIDAPYYYDIIVREVDAADPSALQLDVYVEGKEVGESQVVYDCGTGEFSETIVQDWTGGAARYLPAALMSHADLYC